MLAESKITVGNVCFISNADHSKLLLLKRSRHPMKGLYSGVGGKTHYSEDIRCSCFREVKEETGLEVADLQLKAVIKTILEGQGSSWILFVYVARSVAEDTKICDEGMLEWVNKNELASYDLIGFIREILPSVLSEEQFLEGTLIHDQQGNVLQKTVTILANSKAVTCP